MTERHKGRRNILQTLNDGELMQEWCLRSISRCKVNITDCGNLVSFRRSPFVLLTGSSCLRDETWNGQYSRQETKQTHAHESVDNVTPSPPPLTPSLLGWQIAHKSVSRVASSVLAQKHFWQAFRKWWQHRCLRFLTDRQSTTGCCVVCLFVCVSNKETGRERFMCHWPPSMQDNPWWHSNQQTWLISMFAFF